MVCPELTGHLNPMTTLGRELARRGHRVCVVAAPVARPWAERAGLGFVPIAVREHESGEAAANRETLGRLTGFAALRFTGRLLGKSTAAGLRDLPAAFDAAGIDAVVVDQVAPAGAAVAEVTRRPFAIVCNALAMNQESRVPPGTLGWPYRPGLLGRARNALGNLVLTAAARPIVSVIDQYRRANGLPRLTGGLIDDGGLAHVAQQPAFFDFPRRHLTDHFHYTGPWHESARDKQVEFPWDRLDGQPLVYASLGTLQNRLAHVFRAIVDGCATLDVQLVLSLGRADATWDGPTPANAIIVPFAPQLPLLDRAAVAITHAGLNTALEGLARGLPMLCMPVTNDQPGVANRVRWLGAGLVLSPRRATADRVRTAVSELLADPRYRESAGRCRDRLAGVHGPRVAADIIDKAFATGRRVPRSDGP